MFSARIGVRRDNGWTAATRFQDVIEVDDQGLTGLLQRHVPHFDVRLIDLSEGRAADLVEEALTALGKMVLWSLSVAGDDERFERELPGMLAVLDEVLRGPDPHAALEVLLRYLAGTRDRQAADQVSEIIIETIETLEGKEEIVDIMEEIGLTYARRAKRDMLLKQLAARFGDLPEDVKERVAAARDATLEKWAIRLITAPTLEAALAPRATRAAPTRRAASSSKRTRRT